MWTYNHSDELYHYGRKGMKWGQNIFGKKQTTKGSPTSDEIQKANKAYNKYLRAESNTHRVRYRVDESFEKEDRAIFDKYGYFKDLDRKTLKKAEKEVIDMEDRRNKALNKALETPMKELNAARKDYGDIIDELRNKYGDIDVYELGITELDERNNH